MRARADAFVDDDLIPLLIREADADVACAVVAYGVILGVLFRALVDRIPHAAGSGPAKLPPSWSSTGYMDLAVSTPSHLQRNRATGRRLPLALTVRRVNCTDHLHGLHKTRGGMGSTAFNKRQRTVASFFATPRS